MRLLATAASLLWARLDTWFWGAVLPKCAQCMWASVQWELLRWELLRAMRGLRELWVSTHAQGNSSGLITHRRILRVSEHCSLRVSQLTG